MRVVVSWLLLALASPAAAQPPDTASAVTPGSQIIVTLLTFGPNDNVIEAWAHNAIRIQNPATGFDASYNWGIFNFDDPGFLGRLAKGTMLYSMYGWSSEAMIADYIASNRDVFAQEINLTPAQKTELLERLRVNDTDANRRYRYQYYLDNCSTRARDALDQVLGGRIAETLDTVPAGVTWRWHARRILRTMPAAYVGMDYLLGNPADEQITAWDEGFLPMMLMSHLRRVTVLDEAGREVPLVANETQLFASGRPPEPTEPPFWLPWFLAAGVALGLVIVGAARMNLRVGAALAAVWSIKLGLAGLLLLAAWAFTDHTFWFWNENLFQAGPLSLLLAVALFAGVRGREGGLRWARPVALVVLALSALGFLLQVFPGFDQVNGEIIAAALPAHAAVAWIARKLGREAESARA
jgi:hypothetical protein